MKNILRILIFCISLSVWATVAQAESDFVYRKVTSQDEIVDGGVYVLVRIDASFPGYAGGFSNNAFSVKQNKLVFNNQDEFYATDAYEFTLYKKGDGYNVKTAGGYLYVKSSKLSVSDAGNLQTNSVWDLDINKDDNAYLSMHIHGSSTNNIVYYNTSFRISATAQKPINIYRKYLNTQEVTISSESGYASLCCGNALDFTDSGIMAYTATVSNSQVELTPVTTITAQCPVILYGAQGTAAVSMASSPPSADDQAAIDSNQLLGVSDDAGLVVDAEDSYYTLTEQDGNAVFAPLNTHVVIPKGKAYIRLADSAPAKSLSIVIKGDDVTAIRQTKSQQPTGETYNMAGLRVGKSYRGIVIRNGKKTCQVGGTI